MSAKLALTATFTCTSVQVPYSLATEDKSTGLFSNIETSVASVDCSSSSFIQIPVAESSILGTLRLIVGKDVTPQATTFATSAQAILFVSPFPELVTVASSLVLSSPYGRC